ncbi:MAG: hypothetical protein D6729_17845 [Deltaproteobacteria bacterium]|nr:MAG: hypothetical protein D6729_17845 [Deltaproteobacteria bacterium]
MTEARAALPPGAKLCGHCRIWKPTHKNAAGVWVGPCRLQPGRGDIAASAPICSSYLPRDEALPSAPRTPAPTRRRARQVGPRRRRGGAAAARPGVPRPLNPRHDEEIGELADMTRGELIEILREALEPEALPELAPKWEGGTLILKPGNDTQPKEIPLDQLFKKVVRIRDQLRVLEQKINAHKTLSDAEKVDLQAYITRCYGSLTTFNLLFRHEADRFKGQSG